MIRTILVAVDTSEASQAALRQATEIAKAFSARLVLVNIVDVTKLLAIAGYESPYPVDAIEIMRADAKTILADAGTACTSAGVAAIPMTGEGEAVDEILNIASDEHVDMIALGTHGRQGLSRLFLGSVAEGVLRRANVPVLVVRT